MNDFTCTSRGRWGAKHGRGGVLLERVGTLIIHHAHEPDVPADATVEWEVEAVRGIERFHVETNGWQGIGYQWLVFQSGRVYEGRGWFRTGAHAPRMNGKSIGVCIVIDGQAHEASPAAVAAVQALARRAVLMAALREDYKVGGHRDYVENRTCPGDKLAAQLPLFRPAVALVEPEPDRPALHPMADALVRARWELSRTVPKEDLTDSVRTLRTLALHASVADEPAARELVRVADDVLVFYS